MRLLVALVCLCAGLGAVLGSVTPARSATRQVVMLFDERPELPGLAALDAEFVRTLNAGSADRIEIYREELDRSRFDGTYVALQRDFLRAKYANKKIDAVVAVIGPALDFLLDHGSEIFPGVPIVFCGLDRAEFADRQLPAHVRGVLVKREFAPTLEIALRLHPRTKQVFVVAGTSEFDTRLLEQAKKEFLPYESRLRFTYLTSLPLQQLLTELEAVPPESIVLFTTFFRDGAGVPFVPHEVVPLVSARSRAPLYGFIDQYLGRGLVGGSLYSFSAQGTEAARLVLQVLSNDASSEPRLVEPSTNRILFDWRQMQRWGLHEADLPPGAEIRFRDPTAWDRYKFEMLAAIAAILLQGGLIGWLLHERRYRQRAEGEARETMAELTHVNRMATAGELSAAIAHEVNQPLTGIVTRANAALNWLAGENPNIGKVRDLLGQIVAAGHRASDVVTSVRTMFRKDMDETAPVDINQLIRSVLGLVYVDLRKHGIEARISLAEGLPPVIGNEVQLQQVLLNLMMNAIEAMASGEPRVMSVRSVFVGRDIVRVSVEDTGSGIDPAHLDRVFAPLFTTKTRGMGVGLSICRSIVERHKGKIWASPAADKGSIFELDLPARVGAMEGNNVAA